MPSNAYTGHLVPLLADANVLIGAAQTIRGRRRKPLPDIVPLNRAVVVMCVSAWEAYVEELVREAVQGLRPPAPPMGTWPALNATARAAVGRFNTPKTDQVRVLISDAIGLADIQTLWQWASITPAEARRMLQEVMDLRHAVAHGVNPRPDVEFVYARGLPGYFQRLGRCTDRGVREYLVSTLGVPNPWPP